MNTITEVSTLVVETCPSCGVLHAFPESLRETALKSRGPCGRKIYCPNGHSWFYTGKSEAKIQSERAVDAERRADAERDLRIQEERSHAATKGHLTRTRRRAEAGVCPHCTRTFQNVARHVRHMHPS